jgi:CubicO group peptidase (beta-lactamase class C family)
LPVEKSFQIFTGFSNDGCLGHRNLCVLTMRTFCLLFALTFTSLAVSQNPPAKPKLTEADLPKALDELLAPLIRDDKFSGVLMVSKNGRPVYQKAAGYAHRGLQVPNNMDTKFNLASTGKTFTAVAIAQLVQAGKLSFEDIVGKIDPAFPNQDVREKVKVSHLLTHTSGVPDIFTEEFFNAPRDRFRDLKDYLPLFQSKPLLFEAGTKNQYSNGGFCLLGHLVEKASGMPYWDYVRKHIFEPAGMKDSGPFEMDLDTPNLAYGYTGMDTNGKPFPDGKLRNNLFVHSIKGTPAGGSFSTAGDLTRFAEALKAGRILSKPAFENLIEPKATSDRVGGYGYGWGIRMIGDEKIVGHNGGFLGIGSIFSMYLKSGYTVVIFSNYDEGVDPVALGVRKLLTEDLAKS